MAKDKMNIPQIRFKGFEGEWQNSKLHDLVTSISGNDGRKNLPVLTISAGQGWMDQKDRFSQVIAGKELKNYTLLRKGELSYNKGNSKLAKYGVVFSLKNYEEALVPRVYHSFKVKKNVSSLYIEYLFATKKTDQELGKLITSGARMDGLLNISNTAFMGINIYSPSYKEQTAIGNFFQQIDKLIELQTRAVESAEMYKKAMLQKMFPQKGEKAPRVHFEGFSGDWEDYALHEIANRLDSLRKPVTASERVAGTTPYYGANGIQDYVQGYTHEGEHILIAEDGANNLKDYPIQYVKGKIWVNNHAHVLATKASCNIKFLSFALKRINFIPFLVGGGRAKLNAHVMMQIKVRMPKLEEQIAIGNFFQKLDQQIEQQRQKLATYQQLKKAMLQRMFV